MLMKNYLYLLLFAFITKAELFPSDLQKKLESEQKKTAKLKDDLEKEKAEVERLAKVKQYSSLVKFCRPRDFHKCTVTFSSVFHCGVSINMVKT